MEQEEARAQRKKEEKLAELTQTFDRQSAEALMEIEQQKKNMWADFHRELEKIK